MFHWSRKPFNAQFENFPKTKSSFLLHISFFPTIPLFFVPFFSSPFSSFLPFYLSALKLPKWPCKIPSPAPWRVEIKNSWWGKVIFKLLLKSIWYRGERIIRRITIIHIVMETELVEITEVNTPLWSPLRPFLALKSSMF